MRTIERSSPFKADYKRERKGSYRKSIEADLLQVIELPVNDAEIPSSYSNNCLFVRHSHEGGNPF